MKKIFIIFILLFSQFLLWNNIFGAQVPVEKVFTDIDKNYKYYNELQTLYDIWMIFPDENWKLNPKKLLNRDEFVGISMEVSCKRCISPNTDFSLLKEHSKTQTFYDVSRNNKYFYCIAESDKLWYVKWYSSWFQCEWKEKRENERPFCIDNKITLDEALAVILRNSGIFTIEDNKKVIKQIYDWKITKNLSDDVSPKNNKWQVYTFYWYLQNALNFELKEVYKNWEEKIYKLLEKTNNKIYPYKHISKEEFIRIAYIALKSNSCTQDEEIDLATSIQVLNKKCEKWKKCDNKTFDPNEDTFDFTSSVLWICEKWIEDKNYKWTFFNIDDWTEVIKEWKYVDDYKFLTKWKWRVLLELKDNCWNKWKAYSTIFIKDKDKDKDKDKWLNVQVEADPMIWNVELNVHFNWIVSWWDWNYTYEWYFKDGTRWSWKTPNHTFKNPWTYVVTLIITDSDWNSWEATVVIKVLDFDSCDIDADWDWIMDCDDILPKIPGDEENDWAPKFNIPNLDNISLNECLQKWYSSFIIWNSICNSCPCSAKLDFFATIRKCDLVFPAITSIDSKNIFSRWNPYKIQ